MIRDTLVLCELQNSSHVVRKVPLELRIHCIDLTSCQGLREEGRVEERCQARDAALKVAGVNREPVVSVHRTGSCISGAAIGHDVLRVVAVTPWQRRCLARYSPRQSLPPQDTVRNPEYTPDQRSPRYKDPHNTVIRLRA